MAKGINVINVDCNSNVAVDKTLPRDSYLVTYVENNQEKCDIVQGLQVDIFDHYWDKYQNVKGIVWTEGTANPKMWGYEPKDSKKKK